MFTSDPAKWSLNVCEEEINNQPFLTESCVPGRFSLEDILNGHRSPGPTVRVPPLSFNWSVVSDGNVFPPFDGGLKLLWIWHECEKTSWARCFSEWFGTHTVTRELVAICQTRYPGAFCSTVLWGAECCLLPWWTASGHHATATCKVLRSP